jgi:hypothetical protein
LHRSHLSCDCSVLFRVELWTWTSSLAIIDNTGLSSFENLVFVSGGECGCVSFCLGAITKIIETSSTCGVSSSSSLIGQKSGHAGVE